MSLHGRAPDRLRRCASDMNGVDKEAIVSVRQRPFTNPAMSSWAPRSRLRLRMLTPPLRVFSVWIGSKSVIAMASRPATFGSRRLRFICLLPEALAKPAASFDSGLAPTARRPASTGLCGTFFTGQAEVLLKIRKCFWTGVR